MDKQINVTLSLADFDKLRDGLEIAIELLERAQITQSDIIQKLTLETDIQSFLENFK